jgi:hypothetical protein
VLHYHQDEPSLNTSTVSTASNRCLLALEYFPQQQHPHLIPVSSSCRKTPFPPVVHDTHISTTKLKAMSTCHSPIGSYNLQQLLQGSTLYRLSVLSFPYRGVEHSRKPTPLLSWAAGTQHMVAYTQQIAETVLYSRDAVHTPYAVLLWLIQRLCRH